MFTRDNIYSHFGGLTLVLHNCELSFVMSWLMKNLSLYEENVEQYRTEKRLTPLLLKLSVGEKLTVARENPQRD